MEQFLIGNILVQMDYAGVPFLSEGNLRRFIHAGSWEGDTVSLKCTSAPLSQFQTRMLKRDNMVYGLYSHEDQPLLMYRWGNLFDGFAVWPNQFAVTFAPEMYSQPPLREDWFFSICAFHKQVLKRNGCILHASYVDAGGEAILFTGRSGIGKSTQADLWTRFAGAQVVNGDRALLRKVDGRWTVFGYPSCGTSGICINRTLPLKSIVVLDQSTENQVESLTAGAKIRALVSATELYPWDPNELDMALKVAGEIASEIPVIKLNCRPDREAVDVLKNYLERNSRYDFV